ncbi:MAG: hypothetical protein KGL39_48075 [Patescibacteria group bacterium]|nr:hypothetical protein [Patescibacteria group bacterium]
MKDHQSARGTVSADLHRFVVERDKGCFLAALDHEHVCRNKWGEQHAPTDLLQLTVDHVHETPGGMKGKRAPSDTAHLVAMCWAGNVGCPSREVRQAEREYLRKVAA